MLTHHRSELVLVEMNPARPSPIRFLFSGDLGHYDQPIVKDPASPPACDYLMVESTYGNDCTATFRRMIKWPNHQRSGRQEGADLDPGFRCRPAQEVCICSGSSRKKSESILRLSLIRRWPPRHAGLNRWNEEHDEEYASILNRKQHPLRTHSMTTTSTRDESKRLNDMKGARIIISASGMITVGESCTMRSGSSE